MRSFETPDFTWSHNNHFIFLRPTPDGKAHDLAEVAVMKSGKRIPRGWLFADQVDKPEHQEFLSGDFKDAINLKHLLVSLQFNVALGSESVPLSNGSLLGNWGEELAAIRLGKIDELLSRLLYFMRAEQKSVEPKVTAIPYESA
jgi:hypothetical protein